MGYMMYGMGLGGSFLAIIFFALGAFIFSVVFWLTHNWIAINEHEHKRKKK